MYFQSKKIVISYIKLLWKKWTASDEIYQGQLREAINTNNFFYHKVLYEFFNVINHRLLEMIVF